MSPASERRHELGRAPVRGLRGRGAPPEEDDRPDQLVRDLLRRLHPRLPRQVLGLRLQLSTATTTARRSRTSGTGAGRAWASATRSSSAPWCCLGIWAWKHNRAWTIGFLLGFAAHVLTDVNDSIGTMLLFPFSTLNWSLHTWAYAATVKGGKYLDAAAYYSSLGFMMDLFWFFVVLGSWQVLTREFWRTKVVPRRSARVVVARPVVRRAGPARDLPQRVLLRRVPHDRVDDLGASSWRDPSSTASSTTATRSTSRGPDRGGSSASRCRTSRRGSCSRWR